MSSPTSKSQAVQQQQKQQGASTNAPSATRSTASTSRMRIGNGAGSSFSSSWGGVALTEPPRSMPAFSTTSSITPSESASNIPTTLSYSSRTDRVGGRRLASVPPAPVPAYPFAPSTARYDPTGIFGGMQPFMVPTGSNTQPSLASFPPTQQRSAVSSAAPSSTRLPSDRSVPSQQRSTTSSRAPSSVRLPLNAPPATSQQTSGRSSAALSTARASDNHVPRASQTTTSNVVPRSMGGMPSRAPQQTYAGGWVAGLQPAGINIGASPYGPVNLHYNQVDNRQLTIHNNAPGKVTTTNNNITKTDKSNHHNTHAPQKNKYHTSLANVGNSHTTVSQKATSARTSTAKGDTAKMYRAV